MTDNALRNAAYQQSFDPALAVAAPNDQVSAVLFGCGDNLLAWLTDAHINRRVHIALAEQGLDAGRVGVGILTQARLDRHGNYRDWHLALLDQAGAGVTFQMVLRSSIFR